jgi:hypothetical protein
VDPVLLGKLEGILDYGITKESLKISSLKV